MAPGLPAAAEFALDVNGLDRLKRAAKAAPQAQLKTAATQFEAIFVAKMLQSMRDAGLKSGLIDSQQVNFYQSLYDQQLAGSLAGKGFGLAQMLIRQLSPHPAAAADAADARVASIPRGAPRALDGLPPVLAADAGPAPDGAVPPASVDAAAPRGIDVRPPAAAMGLPASEPAAAAPAAAAANHDAYARFVDRFAGVARAAARISGIPARLILAQAALETGWGQHAIPAAGGGNSHNLFGIKAGGAWHGSTTSATTTEYAAGGAATVRETFRSYRSYLESFLDHARLLGTSARYAAVRAADTAEQAAQALQRCGYATDPGYAGKLIAVMQQIDRVVPH